MFTGIPEIPAPFADQECSLQPMVTMVKKVSLPTFMGTIDTILQHRLQSKQWLIRELRGTETREECRSQNRT